MKCCKENRWILTAFCCLIGSVIHAQSSETPDDGFIQRFLKKRHEKKEERYAAGKPFLSFLVGPGYTPETGFLLGGEFLYTFMTNPDDSLIQRSSVPIATYVSTRGNVSLSMKLNSFWFQDKFRFNLLLRVQDATDDYFGVGFDRNQEIIKSEGTSEYRRRNYAISPNFIFRLFPHFFAGVLWDLNYISVRDPNPYMQEDPDFLEDGSEYLNSGLGFNLNYDSRDFTVNAYEGFFAGVQSTFYGNGLGGDFNYHIHQIDLRTYYQIKRPGNTLAFQAFGQLASGDVPWSELSLIGGNDRLRGYLWGRYRDRVGTFAQCEWRYMFRNRNDEQIPHGFAVWVGAGTVANSIAEISRFLPNGGVGYRFEVQPRLNIRIDFGLGYESIGFYFGFTEAF